MSQSLSLWHQECEIMDNFDFEKVHKCMQALNWRYYDGEPDLDKLKYIAESLINHVKRIIEAGEGDEWVLASTGGFVASAHFVKGSWHLSLDFVVARWEGSPE